MTIATAEQTIAVLGKLKQRNSKQNTTLLNALTVWARAYSTTVKGSTKYRELATSASTYGYRSVPAYLAAIRYSEFSRASAVCRSAS